jgi:hypothetical protein
MNNNPYTTKNPVVYLTFIRTSIAHEVFKKIRDNRPHKLYIFSDGPRNDAELKLVNKTRDLLTNMVDWECELHTYFLDENKGIYNIWRYVCDVVFKIEETMIFLQEDLLPSNSFFRYCDELLDHYKDNNQIYMISGMNYLGDYNKMNSYSYFFKERNTTLGIALWKRTYERFINNGSKLLKDDYYINLVSTILNQRNKSHWIKKLKKLTYSDYSSINIGEEFDLMGVNPNILFNQLVIVPKVNLIKHIGFDENSENLNDMKSMPKRMRQLDDMELFELEFPIKHQEYIIIDEVYKLELSKRFPKRNLIFRSMTKLDRAFRVLIYLGPSNFIKKTIRSIKRLIN